MNNIYKAKQEKYIRECVNEWYELYKNEYNPKLKTLYYNNYINLNSVLCGYSKRINK